MDKKIKVGDLVETSPDDGSGVWLVTDLFRNTCPTRPPGTGARLVLPGKLDCIAYANTNRLRRVVPRK